MNTLELRAYLRKYESSHTQITVCALDELPKQKLKNDRDYAFVVNLSRSDSVGSHWICIWIEQSINSYRKTKSRWRCGTTTTAYVVDSLGFKPRSFQIIDFLNKNCNRQYFCTQQLQQINSSVCGMYAACFIVHMIKYNSFNGFLERFSKNLLLNDLFIVKLFNYYARH